MHCLLRTKKVQTAKEYGCIVGSVDEVQIQFVYPWTPIPPSPPFQYSKGVTEGKAVSIRLSFFV